MKYGIGTYFYIFSYDFLYLYDGNSPSATEIASLTGMVPDDIISSGPNIFLNFLSDDTETSFGFRIKHARGKIRLHLIRFHKIIKLNGRGYYYNYYKVI